MILLLSNEYSVIIIFYYRKMKFCLFNEETNHNLLSLHRKRKNEKAKTVMWRETPTELCKLLL